MSVLVSIIVLASGRSGCQQRVGQRLKVLFSTSSTTYAPPEATVGCSPDFADLVPRQLCWKYLVTQDSNLNHNRGWVIVLGGQWVEGAMAPQKLDALCSQNDSCY